VRKVSDNGDYEVESHAAAMTLCKMCITMAKAIFSNIDHEAMQLPINHNEAPHWHNAYVSCRVHSRLEEGWREKMEMIFSLRFQAL